MSKDNKKYIINLNMSDKDKNKSIQINLRKKYSNKNNYTNTKVPVKSKNLLIHGFIGWNNIKWVYREFWKIYSDEPSFFSKKRFESSIGFIIAQAGMIFFLWNNYMNLTMGEFMLWAGAEFIVAGYYVNQTQREKKNNPSEYYIDEEDFYDEQEIENIDESKPPEDTDGDLPKNL